MNNKLSEKLNAFPKNHQLDQHSKLKIEAHIQEELNSMDSKRIWFGFSEFLKKVTVPISAIAILAIVTLLLATSENINFFQLGGDRNLGGSPNGAGSPIQTEEEERIHALSIDWAKALQVRDGQPRYEIMTDKAKEKFEQEQILRSGENWNFVIGDSSPWVIDYTIKIDDLTAEIGYVSETSEPAYYHSKEILHFVKENDVLLVDEYETIYENHKFDYDELQGILSDLKYGITISIAEQTGLDTESVTIMNDAGIVDGHMVGSISVALPRNAKIEENTIRKIIEEKIQEVSDSRNVIIIKENITIQIESY